MGFLIGTPPIGRLSQLADQRGVPGTGGCCLIAAARSECGVHPDFTMVQSPDGVLRRESPQSRDIQGAEVGEIIEVPEIGALHHHYERRAA
jgi:hypothetical protein